MIKMSLILMIVHIGNENRSLKAINFFEANIGRVKKKVMAVLRGSRMDKVPELWCGVYGK